MNTVWLVALLCWLPSSVTEEVTFEAEVLPLLTQLGCNAGACHGASTGRGEFRLSLWGSDPSADYAALTQEFQGRRVDVARPTRSLLLRKPTGDLEHGGGTLLAPDSRPYQVIARWIAAGTPRGKPVRPKSLVVAPARFYFEETPAAAPLRVMATFDNGLVWEVTEWATFTALDPTATRVQPDASLHLNPRDDAGSAVVFGVEVLRPGQHGVLVRYADQVVPFQVTASFPDVAVRREPPADGREIASVDQAVGGEPLSSLAWWDAVPETEHWIDRPVEQRLRQLGIPTAPPATDAAWLRRLHLDLTGRLPPPDRVLAFVESQLAGKREQEVERLLASQAFVDHWTWQLARWLQIRSLPNEPVAFQRYAEWLRQQVVADVGMDEVLRQLLTAEGDSHVHGPANFSRLPRDARAQAQQVVRVFAGVRLECANCHNHPLDRWTQDDFHGLASVFARVGRGRNVEWLPTGAVTHPRTGQPAAARLPGQRDLEPEEDQRAAVVTWLLDSQHDYLARVTVNRLWQALFGRGLVEPVDDLRPTNPGTHPELLAALARDFADHGYRLRHTLRQLALSETYARSSQVQAWNEQDDRFFSRAYPRSLPAELLVDAIADVTGVPSEWAGASGPSVNPDPQVDRGLPLESAASLRAIQWLDAAAPQPTLDTLGRCGVGRDCGDPSTGVAGLAAQLHLLNGEVINRKLRSPIGRLSQQWQQGVSAHEFVRSWVVWAWSREPSAAELALWVERLQCEDRDEERRRWEDFAWSLLNSRGFRER